MVRKIQNESKEVVISESKKIFQKSREKFLENNQSLELLKKLAENFLNFQ